MNKLRYFFVFILSIILILCLVGLALVLSLKLNLSSANQISKWVDSNQLYTIFISKTASATEQAIDSQYNFNGLDNEIKKDLSSSISKSQFNKIINSIIVSNYAWVSGQSSKPSFSIDISTYKKAYENKISSYIKNKIENLPLCSGLQLIELQNNGPSDINCWPGTTSVKNISTQVNDQIEGSSNIFINDKITADNVDLTGLNINKPYYLKFKKAQSDYKKLNQTLIGIVIAILILFILIIWFAVKKRVGWLYIGLSSLIAGLLTYLASTGDSSIFNRLKTDFISSYNLNSYKGVISTFSNNFQWQYNQNLKYITYVYLGLGLILLIIIFIHKRRTD